MKMQRSAFPAWKSRSKYDKTKREKPYPAAVASGPNTIRFASGREYWTRDDGWRSNRPHLGKAATKRAKRRRQSARRAS